jgi:hypothetical protein
MTKESESNQRIQKVAKEMIRERETRIKNDESELEYARQAVARAQLEHSFIHSDPTSTAAERTKADEETNDQLIQIEKRAKDLDTELTKKRRQLEAFRALVEKHLGEMP